MISSGNGATSALRMNHFRPATRENLRYAVLLVQELLLVHFIQQAALPVPRGDGMQILLPLALRPEIAQLNDHERVCSLGLSSEKDIRVVFAWSAFDAVAEVLEKEGSSGAVEATEIHTLAMILPQ